MKVALPKDWRVEFLGLIDAVEFTHNKGRSYLMWCDGQWTFGHGDVATAAVGVPAAATARDARRIGTKFLADLEQVAS